jgi:small subunit ribosomal protein S16
MLVIRLRRTGKKNKPSYRVVVAEHSYPVNGKFTADLGFYNPHTKQTGLNLDETKKWLDKGAQPSNTVSKILQQEKMKHKSVVIHRRNRKPKAESKPEKPAPVAAASVNADNTDAEVSAEVTEVPSAEPAVEAAEAPATSPEA